MQSVQAEKSRMRQTWAQKFLALSFDISTSCKNTVLSKTLKEVIIQILKPNYKKTPVDYFFFPFEDFANNAGSISLLVRPLTEKSLAALSCNVPPHFSPKAINSSFSFSNPRASSSVTEENSSRLIVAVS